MGAVVGFCISTAILLWGVIKRVHFWIPTLLLDPFDLAERYLGITYPIPAFIAWGLFGLGLFLAVAFTYYEIWQKQANHLLTEAKAQFRDHAEKGLQIFESSEGVLTRKILDGWSREGDGIVKKYLGIPQANNFQRAIDGSLAYQSRVEAQGRAIRFGKENKEGIALGTGIGWLKSRAEGITEFDLKR
jgi:hypothetical protein